MGEINVILTFLILVMCLCLSVIAGKVFQQPNGLGKGSESPIGMIFCVMLTSFTAIQGAFAPFHQASTTLIQCFCEDLERNDGSPVSPYRAYKGLREIIAQEHKDAFSMSNQKKTLGEMLHLEDLFSVVQRLEVLLYLMLLQEEYLKIFRSKHKRQLVIYKIN